MLAKLLRRLCAAIARLWTGRRAQRRLPVERMRMVGQFLCTLSGHQRPTGSRFKISSTLRPTPDLTITVVSDNSVNIVADSIPGRHEVRLTHRTSTVASANLLTFGPPVDIDWLRRMCTEADHNLDDDVAQQILEEVTAVQLQAFGP